MSSSTKWREEQILVICPGSSTTMAQLGCNELTPPSKRFPTRMFRDEETGHWRPYRTYRRKKKGVVTSVGPGGAPVEAEAPGEDEFVEDPDSAEGAVYPLKGGKIVNMDAFLAFLEHVHGMLTTTFHNTPIVLMASPQWTRPDCEAIARYIFEKTKTPALCLLHSGIATQYGLRWPSMTVIDIGYEKVDVTCIFENRVVGYREVGDSAGEGAISGGNVFTKRLFELMADREPGFTLDMAEQLKKSPICEVLEYAHEQPTLVYLPTDRVSPSVGAGAGAGAGPAPAAAASGTTVGDAPAIIDAEDKDEDVATNDDGVLNIADIVTSGQTKEFLAKKEREKAEKAKAGKKGKAAQDAADANRGTRLPNSKRMNNVFHYEEIIQEEPSAPPPKANGASESEQKQELASTTNGEAPDPGAAEASQPDKPEQSSADPFKVDNFLAPPETTSVPSAVSGPQTRRVRRDIEVGLERFNFAERAEIDRICAAIYLAVQNINEMYMRPACWDNLVFVGNGSRLRGLKDNIIQTLAARYLVSPSSATMFTSELPSNMATPSGTGSQTPTGSFSGPPHTMGASTGVNPLLQAATTASLQQAQQGQQHPGLMTPGGAPGSQSGEPVVSHHSHSQTPTSLKLATMPTYLAEWTKHGFEEAMFLGSLVAARLAFCVHNMDAQSLECQRLMSLNRVDYNELGPKAVRTHSMLA